MSVVLNLSVLLYVAEFRVTRDCLRARLTSHTVKEVKLELLHPVGAWPSGDDHALLPPDCRSVVKAGLPVPGVKHPQRGDGGEASEEGKERGEQGRRHPGRCSKAALL